MKKLFGLLLISMALSFVLPLQAGSAVTISLSVAAAKPGDTVMVTGAGSPDVWVAIKAVDSLGFILVFDTVKTSNAGAYSFSIQVPDDASGTIRITAGHGSSVASASLSVNRPDPPNGGGGNSNGGGNGSGGGGNSGNDDNPATPSTPIYTADMEEDNGTDTTIPVTVDEDAGTASADAGSPDLSSGNNVTVNMPSVPGVTEYTVGIMVASLTTPNGGTLTFNTDTGSLTLPSDMLSGVTDAEGKKAEISIGQGDKSSLPGDIRAAIGERPLISMTLTLDGEKTEWNNPGAPVTVRIPYAPTAEELENPECIVVWYIDGSGNAVSVPNGRYDAATGTVTFKTTHFSDYAVSFKRVVFKDVADDAWYAKAVSFIAARDITVGTGGGKFSPEAMLTRGQCIVILMRAYGMTPDSNPTDNFADAGNTWYTGYLAAAKRLGISAGVGNNMFAPEKEITRQEMFTLLYNSLKAIGQLPRLHGRTVSDADDQPGSHGRAAGETGDQPESDSGKTFSDFFDTDEIAPWAKDAMKLFVETGIIQGNGNRLSPKDTTTRSQMAQVLCNLLSE